MIAFMRHTSVPGSEPQMKTCIAESDLAPHAGLQLLLLQNFEEKSELQNK